MKWYGICLLALSGFTLANAACVPRSGSDVRNQSTNVILTGTFSGTGSTTEIFFGQQRDPLVQTTSAGSYRVEVPRALIESSLDRRLYFFSNTGEAAATSTITHFEVGEKKLDPIVLSAQLVMSGTVVGTVSGVPSPIADAEILVGRNYARTDSAGKFAILAPGQTELPVVIHKSGFVQTKGLWQVSALPEVREFHLFNRIEPTGSLSVPTLPRVIGAPVTLYVENTPSAAYVRISAVPFTTAPSLEAEWLDVSKKVNLDETILVGGSFYYQFADKDKKVSSSEMVYQMVTAPVAAEASVATDTDGAVQAAVAP